MAKNLVGLLGKFSILQSTSTGLKEKEIMKRARAAITSSLKNMEIDHLSSVYVLQHIHHFSKDLCLSRHTCLKGIGVFYTKEAAEKVLIKYQDIEGFKDHPNGFQIDEYVIDSLYNIWINKLIEQNTQQKRSLAKLYALYYVLELEDGHDDVKLLGMFSSEEKALEALTIVKKIPELSHLADENLEIAERTINRLDWHAGFVTDPDVKLDVTPVIVPKKIQNRWKRQLRKGNFAEHTDRD